MKHLIFRRGHKKPIYMGGLLKKGGLDSLQIYEVAW